MCYEKEIEEIESQISKCRQTTKEIKNKELELIKLREELKLKDKINTTPWRLRSEELDMQLEKAVKLKKLNSYEVASVKSSINTIIIKSLHIKSVKGMTQEELDLIEPFIKIAVDMVVNNKFVG